MSSFVSIRERKWSRAVRQRLERQFRDNKRYRYVIYEAEKHGLQAEPLYELQRDNAIRYSSDYLSLGDKICRIYRVSVDRFRFRVAGLESAEFAIFEHSLTDFSREYFVVRSVAIREVAGSEEHLLMVLGLETKSRLVRVPVLNCWVYRGRWQSLQVQSAAL